MEAPPTSSIDKSLGGRNMAGGLLEGKGERGEARGNSPTLIIPPE